MKYRFIKENRSSFPVVKMCQKLNVSVNGYYQWRIRKKPKRTMARASLMNHIKELFYIKHKQMAGSPLLTEDLHDHPEYRRVHRSRVAALMKCMGLKMQDSEEVCGDHRF